jgi:glycine/D-amino acid oxidase-like deaminating enzyme
MSPSADVLVIGAGIVGAACAHELCEAGAQVELIDEGTPGGGATAAGMGHLVVIDEPEAEFALTRWSMQRWQRLQAQLPERAEYSGCGTLWLASDEEEWREAQAKSERMRGAGLECELVEPAQLKRLEPQLRAGLRGALRVPGDAVVYAPVVTRWLIAQRKVHRARVARVRSRQHTVSVELADGSELEARAVVIAAGLESRRLAPAGSPLPLRARKGHLVITDRHPGLVRHQLVELGYIKNAHGQAQESVAFNVQPRPTGQLLIGSSRQFDEESSRIDARMLARVVQRAIEFLPALASTSAIRAWTGLRAATPDGLPILGSHPRHPGIHVACGHEGLGITTALASAALVAAGIRGTPPPFQSARFAWERFDE